MTFLERNAVGVRHNSCNVVRVPFTLLLLLNTSHNNNNNNTMESCTEMSTTFIVDRKINNIITKDVVHCEVLKVSNSSFNNIRTIIVYKEILGLITLYSVPSII